MVIKSSVDAVNKANAEREQAIRDKNAGIKAVQSKASHEVYEAHQKQKEAENKASSAIKTLETRSFLYIGLLAYTLLGVAIMNPQVVSDFLDFFKIPAVGIYNALNDYINWLINLSKSMEAVWAWVIRILLSLIIIALCVRIVVGVCHLITWYKSRWCTLSLKVMVITLAIISVFGEPIRTVIPINLILLFFISQLLYLFVLVYFDGYFENRYRTDEWEAFQKK